MLRCNFFYYIRKFFDNTNAVSEISTLFRLLAFNYGGWWILGVKKSNQKGQNETLTFVKKLCC